MRKKKTYKQVYARNKKRERHLTVCITFISLLPVAYIPPFGTSSRFLFVFFFFSDNIVSYSIFCSRRHDTYSFIFVRLFDLHFVAKGSSHKVSFLLVTLILFPRLYNEKGLLVKPMEHLVFIVVRTHGSEVRTFTNTFVFIHVRFELLGFLLRGCGYFEKEGFVFFKLFLSG